MSPYRPSRRQLLGHAALLAAAAAQARPAWGRAPRPAPEPPHHIVKIILTGGFDSVLTVDPKDASRARKTLEVGYRGDERLRGARRTYGPLMKELMPFESELCLLHGVRVDTVAHPIGMLAVTRGGVARGDAAVPIGSLIGPLLPGRAPIPHLCLGHRGVLGEVSPGQPDLVSLSPDVASKLLARPPERYRRPSWSEIVERRRREAERGLFGPRAWELGEQERAAADGLLLRDLLARARRRPPTAAEDDASHFALQLHLAAEAIRTETARFITVSFPALWFDTHSNNLAEQTRLVPRAFGHIAAFLGRLRRQRNRHGALLDQTTVLIGSEVGRFPRVNVTGGKDHWPENSWMLIGKGIRRAEGGVTLGETDDHLRGKPIDFRTGRPGTDQAQPLYIDALYATLVKMAGADPQQHGYRREHVLHHILA